MAGVSKDPNRAESLNYRPHIGPLAVNDAEVVIEKDKQYGASWCKRGGTGAYFVFIRKFDRLEEAVRKFDYNIFRAIDQDSRPEGIIDDIRDIRGYLLLIEAYAIENRLVEPRYEVVARPVECGVEFAGTDIHCEKPIGHQGCHSGMERRVLPMGAEPVPVGIRDWNTPDTVRGFKGPSDFDVSATIPRRCLALWKDEQCVLARNHSGLHRSDMGNGSYKEYE